MRIIRLDSENVKRLRAVSITPDGAVVRITGKNGAGKTSVLDSIALTIGGADAGECKVPVRRGQSKAKTVIDLGDLIVTRTWTAGGGTRLVVSNAEGVAFSSPQAVLDRLVGKLTLDPLAFSRLKPAEQLETLKAVVGIDFSALDSERAEAFSERTDVNRRMKAAQAAADMAARHVDAPTEEVSVSALAAEMERRRTENDKKRELGAEVKTVTGSIERFDQAMQEASKADKSEVARIAAYLSEADAELERQIADLRAANDRRKTQARDASAKAVRAHRDKWETNHKAKQAAENRLVALRKQESEAKQHNVLEIAEQIRNAESANLKYRENRDADGLTAKARTLAEESQGLTARIEAIDAEKHHTLATANFPISDMSFDESGVTFKGLPFEQASAAEKLRASVAIGVALNPKLRVLLVRDGSLLDQEGMKLLAQLAEEHDAQIWLEAVSDTADVGVVIEDGMVTSRPDRKPPAPSASA